MVPDDAGPVPYQQVMRPLRGERTISVAEWFHEQKGRRAGLQSALYDISKRVGPFPLFPWRKQWRLKPLFLVELTLASVLRESFEIITRLGVIFF